jgi:cobalamin biosynthetic protein CobC
VVDEAFADTAPGASVAAHSAQPGLIVLRSLGKFFGLAGVRVGFVGAAPALLTELADWLGPWTVSGPAQQVARAALADVDWHAATRAALAAQGERLRTLLASHRIAASGTALFQWWPEPQAAAFHAHMAERGIWVRLFTNNAHGIRLGLPPDDTAWRRLAQALTDWTRTT